MRRWFWLPILCLMFAGCLCQAPGPGGNLLPNPALAPSPISENLPGQWRPGPSLGPQSRLAAYGYSQLHGSPALALKGTGDGAGFWACMVEGIRPHTTYRLSLYVSRDRTKNRMFPEVEFLGQRALLNQVWRAGLVYPVTLYFDSGGLSGPQVLRLINQYPMRVSFSHPSLIELPQGRPTPGPCRPPLNQPGRFPLGIYGAGPEDFPSIARAGLDTVVVGPTPETVAAAHEAGLYCLISAPKNEKQWKSLKRGLKAKGISLGPGNGFYIDDEPELRAVPAAELEQRRTWASRYFPGLTTAMAMVRPQFADEYYCGADVFMMDQYPIPHMPLTWLSQSIDLARKLAGECRIWAVVQAFGGEKWKAAGWPRMPSQAELRNLSFLSLTHGSQGIFFFSYRYVKDTPHWDNLNKVTSEVKRCLSFIGNSKGPIKLPVQVLSHYQTDAQGKPAMHAVKWRGNDHALIIAVNVLRQPIRALISGLTPDGGQARDIFSGQKAAIFNGELMLELAPLEVKAFHMQHR